MKKLALFALILCLVLAFGCKRDSFKEPPSPDPGNESADLPDTPSTPDTPATPEDPLPPEDKTVKFSDYVFRGDYKDESIGDVNLVSLSVQLPKVENNDDIQYFYNSLIDRIKETAQTHYLPLAKGNYEFASDGLGIFTPITVEMGYEVKLNDGKLFSVRRETYENTGGAHPNKAVDAETFRVSDGAKMLFSDLFKISREEVNARLAPFVKQEMDNREKDGYFYYENAKDEALSLRSEEDFYLTETHLVLFWQVYELAPYAAGLQEFAIPLSDISDILRTDF